MSFTSPEVERIIAEFADRIAEDNRRFAEWPGSELVARRDEFVLPVGPETGGFLHSLILAKRPARVLELGTSYGYSTLFLADALKRTGGKLVSVDMFDYKQAHAAALIERAGLSDQVEFRLGDALELVQADPGPWDLVLLDIWKDLYVPCLHALHPRLADEGIIAADNMIEPPVVRENAREYRAAVAAYPDLRSALLPIGSGIELSVKWETENPKL
ncbi:MAG: class I SAM-dependent methyltransferase [Sphingomonas sp.]